MSKKNRKIYLEVIVFIEEEVKTQKKHQKFL